MRRPSTPDEVVEMFLDAYREGAFPMAELPGTLHPGDSLPTANAIHWYRPDPRAVIPLTVDGLRIPRSIGRAVDRGRFFLTADHAFESVIRACARPGPGRGGAWLDESLVRVYTHMHHAGHAHSVEAWRSTTGILPVEGAHDNTNDQDTRATPLTLLGGIYGVSIGSAFFAESMFSNVDAGGSGASSACLIGLWRHLRVCGYTLLDVQIANEHTLRFGVQEIPLDDYMNRLQEAITRPSAWRAP